MGQGGGTPSGHSSRDTAGPRREVAGSGAAGGGVMEGLVV